MTNYGTIPTRPTPKQQMATWEIIFCVLGSVLGLTLITLSTVAALGSR